MKYYSEITEKLYDTPEELQVEEEKARTEAMAAEQREMERINAKAEIEEAIERTRKLINDYTHNWRPYSYKANVELKNGELVQLCNLLFNRF